MNTKFLDFTIRLLFLLFLCTFLPGEVRATPPNTILGSVALCDPNAPQSCAAPSGGALPVTGTFSATLGGFAPATTGTPIAVTTAGVTGTLPAGVVVAAFNVGTTNTAFCKLGASATTSDIAIPPQSWFGFTVGASTQLTCITSASTTTVNMIGGSGLPTGAGGGGGGGGGGGAITAASGSYASGAISSGAVASGAYSSGAFASGSIGSGAMVDLGAIADAAATSGSTGTLSAKLRLMTTQLGAINTAQPTNAAQGSTTSGQTGTLIQGAVTTAAPAYTTLQSSPLSLDTGGSLRVTSTGGSVFAKLQTNAGAGMDTGSGASSANTLRVIPSTDSTINPTTPANWGIGTATQNSASVANGQLTLAQFNTTPTTITTGNMSPLQMDSAGNLLVNIKAGAGSGGTAIADAAAFTQGTTNETPIGCFFTSGTYTALTSAHVGVVQCTSDGATFSNVYKWAGTALGAPSAYGTSPGAVNVPGVNAFVTNANANGQATMANSSPVTIASNQSAVPTSGAVNVTPTDCSATVVTGGTAVNAFTAQTTLHGFTILNDDTSEVMWISFTTTAAASTAGSYPLAPATATSFAGASSFTSPPGFGTNHALSVVAATSAHKFSCTWW